ncbi:MAG: signal peptidase I [Lachnospiraceae bacterium]|nr:signal peptidase I [Lachnospiraceae bacterium]
MIQRKDEQVSEEKTDEGEKMKKALRASERRVREYQTLLIRLLALLLVVWGLFFVLLGLLRAPNNDMHPRIDNGDLILYYRLDKDVRARDVVVVEKEIDGKTEVAVSRVVAAAGDTVEVTEGGQLIVNGNAQSEPDIGGLTRPYEGSEVVFPLTLGADECFVLADTREGGMDSRYFGPVKRDEIAGTAVCIWRRGNL